MRKVLVLIFVYVLVLPLAGLASQADCGCNATSASDSNGCSKSVEDADDELLQAETESMEWQCIYWWECVEYDTDPCEPCTSLCMLGCIPVCAGAGVVNFYLGMACSLGCPAICSYCGDCEYCVEAEQRHSCGWVFTE